MEHKTFRAEVKEFDSNDFSVVHFISTERRDRGGDILLSDGMRMDGHPVVLLSHGMGSMGQEPIAKNIWIRAGTYKGRKGIQAKTQFYDGSHLNPPDNTGRRLWEKATRGIMGSWSVGWRPIDSEMIRDRETGEETRLVKTWELLEYSLVAVPMQPDAQSITEGYNQLSFKVMPDESRLTEVAIYRNLEGKIILDDVRLDAFLEKTVRQTIQGELNRLCGRIPQRRIR